MTADDQSEERRPAWIRTIAPSDSDGVLAEIYREIAGLSGTVSNILMSQSLHHEALRDHYTLYRSVMFGRGVLSRTERESIAVMVSAINRCHY